MYIFKLIDFIFIVSTKTDQKNDGPITLGNMEDLVPRQNVN